jgi:hypothetical protein
MVDVGVEHACEMTGTDDQEMIEAFPADGADPTLRVRVRVRRPNRGADYLGADRAPHVVGRPSELGVAVADQVSDDAAGILQFAGEVCGPVASPRLLLGWS